MVNRVPISETEMLVSWGRAEIPTGRYTSPPHLRKVEAGADLDANEGVEVAAFMRQVRGPQVEFFLDGRTTWFRGEVPIRALGAVTLDAYWTIRALGCESDPAWRDPPPRTVADLAAHPDAPPLAFDGDFEFDKVRGTVIAVASSAEGDLQLIEGSNRTRGMWRAFTQGKQTPATVPVIVGVHPEAENFKDREAWLALARVGWRNRGAVFVARCVDALDPTRPQVLVSPTTQLATAVDAKVVEALRRIGVA